MVAAAALIGPTVAPVAAACGSPNPRCFTNATVTPGSGSTSTPFTFSVHYQDDFNRALTSAVVNVAGVGSFNLTPSGTTFTSPGVNLSVTTTLPAGTWSYSFRVTSSGSGFPLSTTNVNPTRVTVTAPPPTPTPPPPTPTPKPTPAPTPAPTPKPTPAPTPKPTPAPTAKPTPAPTPKPTAKPTPTAAPPHGATPTPRVTPGGSSGSGGGATPAPTAPGATASDDPGASGSPTGQPPVALGGPVSGGGNSTGGPDGNGNDPSGLNPGGSGGSPIVPILVGSLVAFAGLGGFIIVAGRRRRREPAEALAAGGMAAAAAAPPSWAPAAPVEVPPIEPVEVAGPPVDALPLENPLDETTIPRWRRPSLRAARAASGRSMAETPGPRLEFNDSGASGAERRRVRYRLVRLSDQPDEIRSVEVAQLEEKDEVEILGSYASYLQVRTPLGQVGWVHRTTLGPVIVPGAPVDDAPPPPDPDELEPAEWATRAS